MRPKVLLAPSLQAGYNLTTALARAGVGWVNLRVTTPVQAAEEVAAPHLAAAGWRRLGADAELFLLQEILGLLRPQADAAGVRIEPITPVSAAAVTGDRDQLRQVFLNLAQNAFQAMPNGGVLGVEVGQDGERVKIAIADSGPGVPEAEQELIFLPFVSTKTDGLGLGLPIVRRIVEAHGGSVSCQAGVGGGTAFTVRLPLARPSDGG